METQDIRKLVEHMNSVADHVPNGLSLLKDTLSLAMLDLNMYVRMGIKGRSFQKALTFARSIPQFENFDGEAFDHWLLNDEEHIKYM